MSSVFVSLRDLPSRNCPICTRKYFHPKVSPCGHTYCAPCWDAYFGIVDRKKCPTCRKSIKRSDLATNFDMERLLKEIPDENIKDKRDPNIGFFVKPLTNSNFVWLELPGSTTIRTLRYHILDKVGIMPYQQKLHHRETNKFLTDKDHDKTLTMVGVKQEHYIDVLLRSRGG